MGQNLGKTPADNKAPSSVPRQLKQDPPEAVTEPEPQDEVFGPGEGDASQNNGCVSEEKPAVTDSEGPPLCQPGPLAAADTDPNPNDNEDDDTATPRPHLVRLFSRDAPGREDNTFKERPSESDELQTIQEHSGASECGSDTPEQDLE